MAINDADIALTYKNDLYPKESEIVAEAHYKLSLALEYASAPGSTYEPEQSGKLREQAGDEMALAIESSELKLQNKEVELASVHSPDDNEVTRKQIVELKDIIVEMKQRVSILEPATPYLEERKRERESHY